VYHEVSAKLNPPLNVAPTPISAPAMPGAIVGIALESLKAPASLYPQHFNHSHRRPNLV
jgi:hypothetical protein